LAGGLVIIDIYHGRHGLPYLKVPAAPVGQVSPAVVTIIMK
jgi:hypothetical protein